MSDSTQNFIQKVTPWASNVQSWVSTIPSFFQTIVATIFRLLYRWYLSRFWWDDTWAALALLCNILCLASIWMQITPTSLNTELKINLIGDWLLSLTLTAILWFARLSILCSIVRIANPIPFLRRIAYGVGILFLAMGTGLLAQKILNCTNNHCWFTHSVAVAQLVTDIISDFILIAAPIRFLRGVKLSRDRRVLILSAFSASILITFITILHSILLFEATTNTTLIIGHVKAALALFLCNALVLVTFIYRLCSKRGVTDPNIIPNTGDDVELTSIIELPSKFSMPTYPSGIHNKGEVASIAKPWTQKKSDGSELEPSHAGRSV